MNDKRPRLGRPPKRVFTANRHTLLNAIQLYVARHGRMPTYRYLIETYKLGTKQVYHGVSALAELGYIQLWPTGTIPGVLIDRDEARLEIAVPSDAVAA